MGKYSKCYRCGWGLDVPTIMNAMRGERECPNCDQPIQLTLDDKIAAANALVDRVEYLEKRVASLNREMLPHRKIGGQW